MFPAPCSHLPPCLFGRGFFGRRAELPQHHPCDAVPFQYKMPRCIPPQSQQRHKNTQRHHQIQASGDNGIHLVAHRSLFFFFGGRAVKKMHWPSSALGATIQDMPREDVYMYLFVSSFACLCVASLRVACLKRDIAQLRNKMRDQWRRYHMQ